jgi:hypothetical protein
MQTTERVYTEPNDVVARNIIRNSFRDIKKGITKFSGSENSDIYVFFMQIENLRLWEPTLSDRHLVASAIERLEGDAAKFVAKSTLLAATDDWEEFKTALTDNFESEGAAVASNKFYDTRPEKGEDMKTYADRLDTLASKIWVSKTTDTLERKRQIMQDRDDNLRRVFLRGVPTLINAHLAATKPATFAAARTEAIRRQAELAARNELGAAAMGEPKARHGAEKVAEQPGLITQLVQQVNDLQHQLHKEQKKGKTPQAPVAAYQQTVHHQPKSCHNCGKRNHFIKDCWCVGGGAFKSTDKTPANNAVNKSGFRGGFRPGNRGNGRAGFRGNSNRGSDRGGVRFSPYPVNNRRGGATPNNRFNSLKTATDKLQATVACMSLFDKEKQKATSKN